jgi:hypothetical protein
MPLPPHALISEVLSFLPPPPDSWRMFALFWCLGALLLEDLTQEFRMCPRSWHVLDGWTIREYWQILK